MTEVAYDMEIDMKLFEERAANLYLGRHERYLARRRREGKGPLRYVIKGVRVYHVSDLDSWLAQR